MYKSFDIKEDLIELSNEVEKEISKQIQRVNEDCTYNSIKESFCYV